MERVKKGERYWYIEYEEGVGYKIDFNYENFDPLDNYNFEEGNYFYTKEEAERMAKKLRAVLAGADVIEMPSEEEIHQKVSETYPSTYNAYAGMFEEPAEKLGFWDCVEWFKSKLK